MSPRTTYSLSTLCVSTIPNGRLLGRDRRDFQEERDGDDRSRGKSKNRGRERYGVGNEYPEGDGPRTRDGGQGICGQKVSSRTRKRNGGDSVGGYERHSV